MVSVLEEVTAYPFRHLLKEHWFGSTLFVSVNQQLMPQTMV
jgi:hypothetical protein